MRTVALIIGLLAVLPSAALAQSPQPPAIPLKLRPAADAAKAQPTSTWQPGYPGKHYNKKGALVGIAVGAGLGFWASRSCDGSDCHQRSLAAVAIGAMFGGALGANIPNPRLTGPHGVRRGLALRF